MTRTGRDAKDYLAAPLVSKCHGAGRIHTRSTPPQLNGLSDVATHAIFPGVFTKRLRLHGYSIQAEPLKKTERLQLVVA